MAGRGSSNGPSKIGTVVPNDHERLACARSGLDEGSWIVRFCEYFHAFASKLYITTRIIPASATTTIPGAIVVGTSRANPSVRSPLTTSAARALISTGLELGWFASEPRELEDAVDELRHAEAPRDDVVEIAARAWRQPFAKLFGECVTEAHDRSERRAQVVRDRVSERFELPIRGVQICRAFGHARF